MGALDPSAFPAIGRFSFFIAKRLPGIHNEIDPAAVILSIYRRVAAGNKEKEK